MLDLPRISIVLLLVIVANATPWLLAVLLGDRGAWPVHRRAFGTHKTWRGLVGGVLACAVMAVLAGLDFGLGAAFGTLALAGDLLARFSKRRLQLAPGTEVPLLDQLPESLLPASVLASRLGIALIEAMAVGLAFTRFDLATVRLRHRR
jgi:hypothetical protein